MECFVHHPNVSVIVCCSIVTSWGYFRVFNDVNDWQWDPNCRCRTIWFNIVQSRYPMGESSLHIYGLEVLPCFGSRCTSISIIAHGSPQNCSRLWKLWSFNQASSSYSSCHWRVLFRSFIQAPPAQNRGQLTKQGMTECQNCFMIQKRYVFPNLVRTM